MTHEELLKHGRRGLMVSLFIQHVWASMLIMAVINGNNSLLIQEMFNAVLLGIWANLAVIVGDKGIMLAANAWSELKHGKVK